MKDTSTTGSQPSLSYPKGKRTTAAAHSSGNEGLSALSFLTMLAGELSTGTVDLPCFPNVVLKIRDALSDPNTTAESAARLIGAEPRLAARLLQTANSAALNPSGKRVGDVKSAITRLGQQLVQSAAMAFAVQQMKEAPALKAVSEPMTNLWRRSIAVASIAQVAARGTGVSGDEAFLAGLLHGIGHLYIMVRAVTATGRFDPHSGLADLIEGWHPSIGKSILENWDMGEALAEAVGNQLNAERSKYKQGVDLTDVLVVASVLADKLDDPSMVVPLDGYPSFQTIGLSAEDCDTIVTHASYQLESLIDVLGC